MMQTTVTNSLAQNFIARVSPALAAQDWAGLMTTLQAGWTPQEVLAFLGSHDADARKIAALCVGLIGQPSCLSELAKKLHDSDRVVVEMAEHAMWQIWFRGGSDQANAHVARGAAALNAQQVERAFEHLNQAIVLCPDFAEAYNQRAIAYYISERYEKSIRDCLRVIKLMPLHFGAWSGLGHSHLALGRIEPAIVAYEKALHINPHLECIAELLQELGER
jgi:tetratricopeptide (TPR) repeat protein